MAVTSQLKNVYDLPVFEWAKFLPTATQAISCSCFGEGLTERYIYYLTGTTFYRYDTYTDGYQQLASPPTAAVTGVSMRYSSYGGYRGNILTATANTAVIAGLEYGTLNGYKIRITAGAGQGQPDRTIVTTGESIIKDQGIVTTATANALTDTTKKWAINQFIGYQVRIVFNTGVSQVRKILYNDATNLYFYDANYQQLECWNNNPFSATAPYALPVATAGSQAYYYIEQTTITLDQNWTVQPDSSSSYVVMSGGIWMMSSVAVAPWCSFQYYDVISDTWTSKTALGGLLLAALGTDWSIERTGEAGGVFDSGTATSGGARTLTNSAKTMLVDRYANYQLRITGGTGMGQRKRIVQNSATMFTVESPWTINPDSTSTYSIYGNTDRIYLMGNGNASIYKYNVEVDTWFQGNSIDFGQTINISARFSGQEAFAISTGVRNTGGVTVVASSPANGGTGYVVGDILTLSTTGTGGKVRVTAVNAGVITAVSLYACGSGYSTGTSATTGGTGTSATITISTVGVVGRITLVQNTNLALGDTVTFAGCTEALWNASYTVLGIDSLTTFDVATTATATMVAAFSQGTTLIVDPLKNWAVNEHVGKLVSLNTAGTAPTTQVRRITSNTATTLTVATIVAGANGTSRYIIHQPQAFGKDEQWKVAELNNNGKATGGSATTLVDSTKNWYSNQWAGYKFRVNSGLGVGSEITITSNTSNTLTYSSQSFTPDATTDYIIMDTFGLATGVTNTTNAVLTDTTKNWTTNMWAGKRVKITSGLGLGQEVQVLSNTANALTFTGVFGTAPDTTSTYCILGAPVRGSGIEINWMYNTSNPDTKGKYLYVPRGGGSNVIDRYDITNEIWDFTIFTTPQSETFNTGSMWTYDGGDRLYFTVNATGRVGYLDVSTHRINGAGQLPYAMGTAVIGNRMEALKTTDGLTYLYIMRHSGQEMFRTLVFW